MSVFSYDEVQRERLTILLNGIIRELAWQDDIIMHSNTELKNKIDYKEVSEIIIDKLYSLEDEDFIKFKKKLIDLIYDIV